MVSCFLSTRLEAAESEIERLTGILKERDGHEKEQNGKRLVMAFFVMLCMPYHQYLTFLNVLRCNQKAQCSHQEARRCNC